MILDGAHQERGGAAEPPRGDRPTRACRPATSDVASTPDPAESIGCAVWKAIQARNAWMWRLSKRREITSHADCALRRSQRPPPGAAAGPPPGWART